MEERNTKPNVKEKTLRKLSSAEHAAVGKCLLRSEARPFVRLKVSEKDDQTLAAERYTPVLGRELLMKVDSSDDPKFSNQILSYAFVGNAVGSADPEFVDGILRQLIGYNSDASDGDLGKLNFVLSVMNGYEPKDQFEGMLAAQMAVVHAAIMDMARRIHSYGKIDEVAERAVNKLTRTFALQLDALKRYREGPKQKITLQQISVADGAQAIVGDVTQAPNQQARHDKSPRKSRASPQPASDATNVVPMPTIDKRKQTAPVARRRVGSK